MSNKKNSPKSEESILSTSATSADLEGINLPAKQEETPEAKEAREAAEAEAREAAVLAKVEAALKTVDTLEAKKAAEERAKAAKDAAKEAHVKQFEGNAKALLIARKVEKVDTKLKFHDFQYSFIDENGMNVPEEGRVNITEVFTTKAAKAFREAISNIARQVVPFHNAEEGEAKAAERAKVAEDFKLMFTYCGVTCEGEWTKARRPDMNAILSKAFDVNFLGDNDALKAKVLEGVWSIARRILTGREAAQNAFEARAKAAKEAAKEAHVKQFEGNAKAFLLARRVDKLDKKLVYHDFKYSFIDEAGMNVPEEGKCDVTEVFTKKAAKAYREAALNIARQVVPFHNAEAAEAKAVERAKVAEDFKLMFEYCGVTCEGEWTKARRPDMNAIMDKAFDVNFLGDNDALKAKVLEGVWSIARRILTGREAAQNAFEAREAEAKKKAEAAKTEGK